MHAAGCCVWVSCHGHWLLQVLLLRLLLLHLLLLLALL
jgi:hypothetical protein